MAKSARPAFLQFAFRRSQIGNLSNGARSVAVVSRGARVGRESALGKVGGIDASHCDAFRLCARSIGLCNVVGPLLISLFYELAIPVAGDAKICARPRLDNAWYARMGLHMLRRLCRVDSARRTIVVGSRLVGIAVCRVPNRGVECEERGPGGKVFRAVGD